MTTQRTNTPRTIPQTHRTSGRKSSNQAAAIRTTLRTACDIEPLESRLFLSVSAALHGEIAAPAMMHADAMEMSAAKAKPVKSTLTLAAPTALAASATAPTTVQLSWHAGDSKATGYVILRATDGTHFSSIGQVTSSATTAYTDTTALSFHTYQYEVEEYSGSTTSSASAHVSATTPLATPTTITATATTPSAVQLTWTINEPSASGYDVLRSTGGSAFSQIAQLPSLKTGSYADTTVHSGSLYSYEVQAYNGSSKSAASKVVAVATPLVAPTALAATFQSGAAKLTWTDNDSAASGYWLFRSVDGAAFTKLATLTSGSAASYSDSPLLSGNAYSYEVQAYNANAASGLAPVVTVTDPLAAPTALTATTVSSSSIQLAWTDNDKDAAGYMVLRSSDGTHFNLLTTVKNATASSFLDATGASGQTYAYEIEAMNGSVDSPASASASAKTLLATPTALTAAPAAPTTVKLAWTNADSLATGFTVLRSTDGVHFSQIALISSVKTTGYVDTTASSATVYSYQVQAYNATDASAATKPVAATTPLVAPAGLAAALQGTSVTMTWTDSDANAAGYYVLRSVNGGAFATIATLAKSSAASYSDSAILSGHAYAYEVQAYAGSITSAATAPATVSIPLAAPSALSATVQSATSVSLAWTDNDANAAGYIILRSTDGVNFTSVTKLTGATTAKFVDTAAASGTTYTYEVEAYAGTITSAAATSAAATTPLATPTGLAATVTGSYVSLAWTDKDASATGYTILRSTDNVHFSQLTTLTGAAVNSYVDTTVAAGQTYYYQVQATNSANSSAVSATTSISVPAGTSTGVSVTTRYSDELVITAAGTSDSVSIAQSGSTLTIVGDGQTFTETAPAAGVFVYARGGNDSFTIAQSVTANTTVDTIDNGKNVINSSSSSVTAWINSTDTLIGTANVHRVASFAGGVSKALGAALANPTDSGTTAKANLSLFGTGPVAGDINQGYCGDCYFLSSLAAFAGENPKVLTQAAVDLGDGTYAVQFENSSGNPVYVRVNNSFPTEYGSWSMARPGANNTIWAMVFEKAFCYFRTGANTYASIWGGWMGEVYSDLGVQSTFVEPSTFSETALYTQFAADLAGGEAVTMGTSESAPNLVSGHAYTLISVSIDANGVTHYVVRNPWGISGDSLENSQGYATLTYAQFCANFVEACAATD